MEHAKRKTQQYTKYTQYINENVLNEKRNSSINIKCSKFVLFMFFLSVFQFYLLISLCFVFDFFEEDERRTWKQRLDRIRALQSVDRQIDRSINTCNLMEICICEANGCEVGFSEIVSAMEND